MPAPPRLLYRLRAEHPLALPLVVGAVEAGFPSPAADYVEEVLDLHAFLIRNPPSTFLMRGRGASMEPAHIFDGDLLIVDRSIEPRHNSIVVASIDGGLAVKRLYQRGGQVGLISGDDAYPPVMMADGMELVVWGVVTHSIHSFL